MTFKFTCHATFERVHSPGILRDWSGGYQIEISALPNDKTSDFQGYMARLTANFENRYNLLHCEMAEQKSKAHSPKVTASAGAVVCLMMNLVKPDQRFWKLFMSGHIVAIFAASSASAAVAAQKILIRRL